MTYRTDAEPVTRISQYTVNCLPGSDINASLYAITVQERGQLDGQVLWAVCWQGRCLDAKGRWDYEPIPSSRTDRWLAKHRHELDTALRLAREAAPRVEVNGHTAVQASAWAARQDPS